MTGKYYNANSIYANCSAYRPSLITEPMPREAAVSLIVRSGPEGAEILFIERARRVGDPWSGQMAFPGGRRGESDATLSDTAERETREEVGIRLERGAYFGRLDDLIGHSSGPAPGLAIACFAYELRAPATIAMNEEVHDVIWIPVSMLADADLFVDKHVPSNYDGEFPGIRCGHDDSRVIWGLTYRFMCVFFKAARIPFAGNA